MSRTDELLPSPRPVLPSWMYERDDDGWYEEWRPDYRDDELSERYEDHTRRQEDYE